MRAVAWPDSLPRFFWVLPVAMAVSACAAETEAVDDGSQAQIGRPEACADSGERHVVGGITLDDNNDIDRATVLETVNDDTMKAKYLHDQLPGELRGGQGDVDWYEVIVRDTNPYPMTFLKPDVALTYSEEKAVVPFRLCAFAEKGVQCESGSKEKGPKDLQGCCHDGRDAVTKTVGTSSWKELNVRLDLEWPLHDDTQRLFIRVQQGGSAACERYRLRYSGGR
jgi:hypothetical protein